MTDRATSTQTENRQEEAEIIIQDISSFIAPHPTHSLFAMRTMVSELPRFLPIYHVP